MLIEVISVNVENKGKYRVAVVNYKDGGGKVDTKKVMSFTHKDVFKVLSESQQGDKFEVKSEKNEGGYWEWTQASASGKSTGVETTNKTFTQATRSTYETPEERAKRQVYIVRQSSITAAIELAKANGEKVITEEDIITSARKFEAYVFATNDLVRPEAEVT